MDKQQKFIEILSGFETAMLTTRGADGHLSARPMAVAKADSSGDLWLVCHEHSEKIHDLESNPLVVVTMQSSTQYLTMSGRARVKADRSAINSLWRESWNVWFPAGKSDRSLTLVQVIPIKGEFWDNSGSRSFEHLFAAGRAYSQSDAHRAIEDSNAKVSMESTWIE